VAAEDRYYSRMLLALEAVDNTGPFVIQLEEGQPLCPYPSLLIVRGQVVDGPREVWAMKAVEERAQRGPGRVLKFRRLLPVTV